MACAFVVPGSTAIVEDDDARSTIVGSIRSTPSLFYTPSQACYGELAESDGT